MVLRNGTGDEFSFAYRAFTESIDGPFEISPGIVIPVGLFKIQDWGVRLVTSTHRRLAANLVWLRFYEGTYFGGDRTDLNGELTWRPSARFRGNVNYRFSEIDLPQGSFETRLVAAGIDFAFTPTLS